MMKPIVIIWSVFVVFFITSLFAFNFFSLKRKEKEFFALGTLCKVIVVDRSFSKINSGFDAASRVLKNIENEMSVFNEDTHLSLINKNAFHHEIEMFDDTAFVLRQSLLFSEMTNGAFDVTTLPLSKLWGFGSGACIGDEFEFPAKHDIENALAKVGWDLVEIRNKENSAFVKFKQKDVSLDFGGIAKGYACDVVVAALKELGIKNAMVNVGGNIFAFGFSAPRKKWTVAIRNPRDGNPGMKKIFLQDAAVSTSGDYEQFFMKDGVRYSHIIDPRSGYPVKGSVAVSVVAESAMLADVFSTAFFVLGPDNSGDLKSRLNGIEFCFSYFDGNQIKEFFSNEFNSFQ